MATDLSQKIPMVGYSCKNCDYNTSCLKDYKKHLLTRKHTKSIEIQEQLFLANSFVCKNCQKIYKDRSGLWRHKQKCSVPFAQPCVNDKTIDLTNLVLEMVKQNQELQRHIIKICETGIIQNSQINSNNKTFNLNLFLNEQCKDAMNLTEFVDSLHLQLTDLEKVGELGYVNGLSNIIIDNLKSMELHKRPVHCSDTKRETIYVKDENKWEKENEEKDKLNKAIKNIATKNIRLIPKWRETNPECIHSESNKSDQYNDIIIHSMDTDKSSNQKIITNIAKEIKIDKENTVL